MSLGFSALSFPSQNKVSSSSCLKCQQSYTCNRLHESLVVFWDGIGERNKSLFYDCGKSERKVLGYLSEIFASQNFSRKLGTLTALVKLLSGHSQWQSLARTRQDPMQERKYFFQKGKKMESRTLWWWCGLQILRRRKSKVPEEEGGESRALCSQQRFPGREQSAGGKCPDVPGC